MSVRKNGDKDNGTTAVLKVTLSNSVFKSEDDARKYLNEGFENYQLEAVGKEFVARNSDVTEDQFKSVRAIKIADGVTAHIGQFKDGETSKKAAEVKKAAAEVVEVAKETSTPEFLKKYDGWSAYLSGATSIEDVMKAGLESSPTPPGFYEVFDAMYIAMDNSLKAGNAEELAKIGASAGTIISKLSELFVSLVGSGDKSKKEVAQKMLVKKEVILDDAAHAAEQAAQAAQEAAKTEEPAAEEAPAETELQTFAKAITAQLDTINNTIMSKIDTIATEQKAAVEALNTTVAKATADLEAVVSRVSALETTNTTVAKSGTVELESMTNDKKVDPQQTAREERRAKDFRKALGY